ncbi:uncharacterized protein TNCV_4990111 [Trichonephila clavipes]|uniref:Uncharacterized protein n=1 Tax=Trichonephila clavipes TaxID=2585209 RepID=A0A8X6WBC6_TRICX|nr:uncharacterized protein TNCV_4990111 [Trichonephila clavipes]
MLAQRLARYTPPSTTPDQLWRYVESIWNTVTQGYIHSLFESMLRRGAAVLAINGGNTSYYFCQLLPVTRGSNFNRLIFVQHVICQINFAVTSVVFLSVAFCLASS